MTDFELSLILAQISTLQDRVDALEELVQSQESALIRAAARYEELGETVDQLEEFCKGLADA